jgi:hypothetical protein
MDCGIWTLISPNCNVSSSLYFMSHCLCNTTVTWSEVWFKICLILTKFEKEKKQDILSQYLLPFSSECCMYSAIELTLFLSFCVGVKLVSYIKRRTQTVCLWEQGGEGNIWCEREVGIEGCRRFCSDLHVYFDRSHPVVFYNMIK